MEEALVALSLASTETAPTDIANDEPSPAEKKDPASELSKIVDGAGGKTDEIGIPLDSDEDAILKLPSAIKLQENLQATSSSREFESESAQQRRSSGANCKDGGPSPRLLHYAARAPRRADCGLWRQGAIP